MEQPTPVTKPPRPRPEGAVCDLCGAPTVEIHCRITCTACGYERDCSDP